MSEITVTMSIQEYERLKEIERHFNNDIKMFERAWKQNEEGNGMLTEELKRRIEEIYL